MFELVEVVDTTAFFRRTTAETFDPYCDGWWLQKYNAAHFPVSLVPPAPETVQTAPAAAEPPVVRPRPLQGGLVGVIKSLVPLPIKKRLKKMLS